jgi:hypothetical protein
VASAAQPGREFDYDGLEAARPRWRHHVKHTQTAVAAPHVAQRATGMSETGRCVGSHMAAFSLRTR